MPLRPLEEAVGPLWLAGFIFPEGHPQLGKPGLVLGYAIPTADGVVLYETGFGEGNVVSASLKDVAEAFQPRRGLQHEDSVVDPPCERYSYLISENTS